MAARRALDHAGFRLSRESWKSLSVESRRHLVDAGSAREVDVDFVRRACAGARPEPEPIATTADPPSGHIPETVSGAFGPSHPITPPVWAALSPLDRFALAKVADRARPE